VQTPAGRPPAHQAGPWTGTPEPGGPAPGVRIAGTTHAAPSPLVGRDTELEQLGAALDALEHERLTCLTVAGDPGIGKTRLLRELRDRAEERRHLVLSGAAAEFERDLPYSVWVDALDAYVGSQELELGPDLDAELASLLPSVRSARAGSAVADDRFRAHRAVKALLEALAAHRGLVLVLDDLHWSDDASLELIGSLLRRGLGRPVLLALAYRPGQAPQRLLAALAGANVTQLQPAPLDEAQSATLLGEAAGARDAAVLFRHSGGNPFYLEQLLRAGPAALVDAGVANGGGIPPAVTSALVEELATLGPDPRHLLEAAAITGEPFEPDLTSVVAELDAGTALDALDDLLARDLVRPTDVPRWFSFRHPLVRRTVYEHAPAGWRIAAHARAAAALGRLGAPTTDRARHIEQCAAPGDEEAIELLITAGAEASARAPATAARWFEAALRLLHGGDQERQVDVRVALASALRSTGELERSRDLLLEAAALLPDGAHGRRVQLVTLCAAVEHWLGRHEEAHDRLVRAWEELPDGDSPEAAALLVELAVDGLYHADYERARTMAARSLETARSLGARPSIAAAAAALTLSEAAMGDVDRAREHRDVALAALDGLTDAELAPHLEALYQLCWAENYLEHYDIALARADRALAIARATGAGRMLVPLMLVKVYPLEMQGQMAATLELCETALEAERLSPNPHYRFWALFELGWARYYAGDPDGAIDACEESAALGHRMRGGTMPSTGGGPGWALGTARLAVGEVERAAAILSQVGGENLEHMVPVERCFDWEVLAGVEIARGDLARANRFADAAEADAERFGLRLSAALAARTRAAVQMANGEHAAAAASARASAEHAEAIGAGLQAAYSRALLGRALAEAGQRDEAIAVLRAAERALDELGSVRPRDEARRDLRRLGARTETRGPASRAESGVEALTKREREIAELVTERKTNRQIAATLFLSDKTIESHLRNVFVKLGASSRMEVALAVDRYRRGVTRS
jgi:DNA-binding NarL/FixJ family response regulator